MKLNGLSIESHSLKTDLDSVVRDSIGSMQVRKFRWLRAN